ncbi:MAG: cupredoxin domain-containing protein [Candidatus Cloacimonetes bacterium]|nr:cupredoxin domain-containing protein [Candidatus Cloacimonadota bacterium]
MKKMNIIIMIVMLAIASLYAGAQKAEVGIATVKDGVQTIEMSVDRYGWHPNVIIVQKSLPVKWQIDGKDLNGCNSGIMAKELALKFDIKEGQQVQEFTPEMSGEFKFSCLMDMIPGKFIIVDDLEKADLKSLTEKASVAVTETQMKCCGKCGMTEKTE